MIIKLFTLLYYIQYLIIIDAKAEYSKENITLDQNADINRLQNWIEWQHNSQWIDQMLMLIYPKNWIHQWQHNSSMNGSYNDVNRFKTLNRLTETWWLQERFIYWQHNRYMNRSCADMDRLMTTNSYMNRSIILTWIDQWQHSSYIWMDLVRMKTRLHRDRLYWRAKYNVLPSWSPTLTCCDEAHWI